MAKKKQRAAALSQSAPEFADNVPEDVRAELAREQPKSAPVALHVGREFIPEDALADEDAQNRAAVDDESDTQAVFG